MEGAKYSGGGVGPEPLAWVTCCVGPSGLARAWAYAVVLVGLVVILWLPLAAAPRAGLVVVLVMAALRTACREGCRSSGPVRLHLTLAGEVMVEEPGRPLASGPLHRASVVFTRLVIIRYRPAGSWVSRALVVVPDAVEPDAFRRLRVLLRAR